MDQQVKFLIDGTEYTLDVDSLTFGEVEVIEDATGKGFGDLDFDSAKALMALALVAMRRKNPLATLDDIRALPLSAIQPVEEESPTQAGVTGEAGEGDSGVQSSQ